MMKTFSILFLILVSTLILAACESVATPTPAPTATGTPPPSPTLTASPTPTSIPTPTLAPVPGPHELTNALLAAFNAGDVEALRDIYSDNVVFTPGNMPYGPGGQPITSSDTGKGAVIAEQFQVIEANAKITLSDTSASGNVFRGRFSYTDDRTSLANIGLLTGAWETVAEGGKIIRITMTFDEETFDRWRTAVISASAPLPPIVVADGTSREVVMEQLPGSEMECIRQILGEAAFGRFARGDFSQDTSEAEEEALSLCLSNESLARFFIGFAVSELGGLGDATIACMGSELMERDMQAVFFGETAWGETFQAMVGCLSDDEMALAEASGFFGGEGDEGLTGSPGLVDVGGRQLYLTCKGDGSPTVVMEAGGRGNSGSWHLVQPSVAGGEGDEGLTGSPGLVDVGGRQLYLTCKGDGSPTVVMEAGGRGNSGSWHLVQPSVAGFTRVCAYDRAGTGYSESAPVLDTAQQIADELHNLLKTAGIDGPYVLVGHSLGGHLMRTFANRYLNEVVGMVLVDTGHGDPSARFQSVLTQEEWQLVRDAILHKDQGFTLPEGLDLLGPDLGDIPLVVLTAGRRGVSPLPPDIAQRLNQVQQDTQEELLNLSSNNTHITVADSGHSIQIDRPDVVVDAIQQVVEEIISR